MTVLKSKKKHLVIIKLFTMEEFEVQEENPKRSTFLLVLCILTFIGSGYYALYYLLLPMAKPMLPQMLESYQNLLPQQQELNAQMKDLFIFLGEVANIKYICLSITYIIAIVGAALMLKMKKIGFHLYIIAQILTFCCLNFLIGGLLKMSISSILWSLIFILLYGGQLRKILFVKKEL